MLKQGGQDEKRQAWESLWQIYEPALQDAAKRLSRKFPVLESSDLFQEFYIHCELNDVFEKACEQKGRLRSWLWKSLRNFTVDCMTRAHAQKRDSSKNVPFDSVPESELSAHLEEVSRDFDLICGKQIIEIARREERKKYQKRKNEELFDLLFPLVGEYQVPSEDLEELSRKTGRTINNLTTSLFRLRQRIRGQIIDAVKASCGPEANWEDEFAHLKQVLGENGLDLPQAE